MTRTPPYPDWLDSVVEERQQLLANVKKLRAFDTSSVSAPARALMVSQEHMMDATAQILLQRISLWERENPEIESE
jgi:hypothetical protein